MFSWFWIMFLWIKEAFVGLVRNTFKNISAVFLSTVCLLLFASSYVIGEYGSFFADELENKVVITIILYDEVTNYGEIQEDILKLSEVEEVSFESKDEALENLKKELPEFADVLEIYEESPLAASFSVGLYDSKKVTEVAEEIMSWEIAENVQYGEGYVERLLIFTENARYLAYFFIVIIAIYAGYIVNNAISANIERRKDEIRIKQLTGAGNATIRMPFVLEAMVLMSISGSAVYYLFHYGYDRVMGSLREAVPYAPILPSDHVMQLLTMPLFSMALAIGFLGSFISVQRYLKRY